MIVDVHAHIATREYVSTYRRLAAEEFGDDSPAVARAAQLAAFPGAFTDEAGSLETRLREMDDAGVERQVLSLAATFPHFRDERRGARAARVANETMVRVADQRSDRFSVFISVPLPHASASTDEIEFWRSNANVVGVELPTSVFGESTAAERYAPVLAAIERAWGLAFYHPIGNGLEAPLITDHGLEVSVGTSFEDTTLAVQLAMADVAGHFPELRHIVPHFGGMVSVLLERLDNQRSTTRATAVSISDQLRGFYYDTVAHGSHAALRAAETAFGPARLVAGSDYPIVQVHEPYTDTFSWIEQSGLSQPDVERILHGNAEYLLAAVRGRRDRAKIDPQPTEGQHA